jgi:NAD(P)-dependent dehydrogenase (short-subunit alcohol dehydrogenase family)
VSVKRLREQVVVITGASSGIGRETALRMAAEGARVVVSARSEAKLQELVSEIARSGGQARYLPADVAVWVEVEALAEFAVETFGRIDTWVHCAGVGLWARFEETNPAEWERVIDVNLNGVANGCRAALPHLRQSEGALIVVSSAEGAVALPYQSAYGASKAAVHALVRSLRLELTHEGCDVRVTEIMPSGTNTPIFEQARTRLGARPRPPGPMYEPGVVAKAILYAAEHRVREMPIGLTARAALFGQALSGPLMDRLVLWFATDTQRTPDAKRGDAPTNLFQPIESEQRTQGDFDAVSRSWSGYTWLQTHPGVKRALTAGLALIAAAALLRRDRSRG